MHRRRIAAVALLLVGGVVTSGVQTSADQLGGLIRRGTDAAKKAAGVEPEAAKEPAPPAANRITLDPNRPLLTDRNLDILSKRMEIEIELREELVKELDAMKPPEEYKACMQQVAGSAAALDIQMRVAKLPDNATPAELQAVMERNDRDLQALLLNTCGPDGAQINVGARLRDIRLRAIAATEPLK
jgi:hypothetical protein